MVRPFRRMAMARSIMHGSQPRNVLNTTQTNVACREPAFAGVLLVGAGVAFAGSVAGSALPAQMILQAKMILRAQMKKARRIRQAFVNLVAGAGFEPTTFGL